MSGLDMILARLPDAKRHGDRWQAHCPAHDDQNPSLSVWQDEDGRPKLKCFAGCDGTAVLAALGLSRRDLAPTDGTGRNGTKPKASTGQIVKTYQYTDEHGAILFEVVRYDPKDFRQRRPDGNGGWVWSLANVTRVLYRLPAVVDAVSNRRAVYVAEGEKDADALAKLGLCGTTCPQGAGKWRAEYSEALRGAHVAVLPDNDPAGAAHADQVARALYGIATSVRIVNLPSLPPKGDVSDWVAAGGTANDLRALAKAAPAYVPPEAPQSGQTPSTCGIGSGVVCMADVHPERVEWLWAGRIPKGKLTVLDGDPGQGKSVLTLDIVARLSRGRELPGDDMLRSPVNVLLLSAEDGPGDTIRPRLDAADPDLRRVFLVQGNPNRDGVLLPLTLPADTDYLREQITEHDAGLVVIDPLMAYFASQVDSHKDQHVRLVLAHLARVAEDTGAAIVLVRHLNKAPGGRAIYRGGGSMGIIGAARSGLLVGTDPHNEGRRVVAPVKSNLARPPASLAFTLDEAENGAAKVVWQGVTDLKAADLLGAPATDALGEAADWLQALLAGGPQPSADVESRAKAHGISSATLRRAKQTLGIRPYRQGYGGPWFWELPAVDAQAGTVSTFGATAVDAQARNGPDEHLCPEDPFALDPEEALHANP